MFDFFVFFFLFFQLNILYFKKCLEEDLENDIDCIILAKKYADIRAKLVFENNKVLKSITYRSYKQGRVAKKRLKMKNIKTDPTDYKTRLKPVL